MAGETESVMANLMNYVFGRNYRIALLFSITLIMVMLLFWTNSNQLSSKIHKSLEVEQQLKVKLETLPPIPVKIILEQSIRNESKNDTKVPWDYNWDFRHWKNMSDMEGVPSRTIYLIRHGQYDKGSGRLNDRGHEQAKLTGQRLKAMKRPFSKITYSTHLRATETAVHISKEFPDIPSNPDEFLREGSPVPPSPPLPFWHPPERDYFLDGPRLEAAFRKYFFRADKSQKYQSFEIIVAHANIIRYVVLRALQFEKSGWMRLGIPHASITAVTVNPDSFVLMSMFGSAGHMPVDMVTY